MAGWASPKYAEWLTDDIIAWLPYYARDKGKGLKELLPNYWKQRKICIDYTKNKAVSSRIANSIEILTNIEYKRVYFLYLDL